MSTTLEAQRATDTYALARTPEEYERLRVQSRAWEAATSRLFDQVGLAAGASCLDAGCGPGETMRLMAQRVGPTGRVTGIAADAPLGAQAMTMLQSAGHRQCRFVAIDLTADEPVPGAPFDLVYARLLLYHLPQRVSVLRRLWDAVAAAGHLLIQEYDLRSVGILPALDSVEELRRVLIEAFTVPQAVTYRSARDFQSCSPRPGSERPTAPTCPATSSRSPKPGGCSPPPTRASCQPRSRTASPPSSAPPRRCPRSPTTPNGSPTGRRCGPC